MWWAWLIGGVVLGVVLGAALVVGTMALWVRLAETCDALSLDGE